MSKDRPLPPPDPEQMARVFKMAGDSGALARLSYRHQIEDQVARQAAGEDAPAHKGKRRRKGNEMQTVSEPSALASREPGRPLWMPDGEDLELLPPEVRQAAAEIVQPAYDELVLQAGTGMERSLGALVVHLLWLEILDQFDIKKEYDTYVLKLGLPGNRKHAIDQYLKLLDAKLRVGNFMIRLRELRLREQKASRTNQKDGSGATAETVDGRPYRSYPIETDLDRAMRRIPGAIGSNS